MGVEYVYHADNSMIVESVDMFLFIVIDMLMLIWPDVQLEMLSTILRHLSVEYGNCFSCNIKDQNHHTAFYVLSSNFKNPLPYSVT